MRVSMNKTKVMISGERQKVRQKTERWPYGVCGKGVGSNSLQCTSCQKWVHKKCRATLNSLDMASMTITNNNGLNPEPWCIPTFTSKPLLLP